MIFAMHFLLMGESQSEESYSSGSSGRSGTGNGVSDFARLVSDMVTRSAEKSARRVQGGIRANVQRRKCTSEKTDTEKWQKVNRTGCKGCSQGHGKSCKERFQDNSLGSSCSSW